VVSTELPIRTNGLKPTRLTRSLLGGGVRATPRRRFLMSSGDALAGCPVALVYVAA